MTDTEKVNDIIDLRQMYAKLWMKKRLFVKVLCATFVLSAAWILPEPRTYTTTVILAPEMSSLAGGSALGDIASNFGIDIGGSQTADAIYPTLYPDIMGSTTFAISLFDINVKNVDGDINTTYYDYLDKHQKFSFWKWPIKWINKQLSALTTTPEKLPSLDGSDTGKKYNEFFYSKRQDRVIKLIQGNLKCSVDKKTDVITFSLTDQDKLISASVADSICERLQDYIIDYRTRKARVDVEYYEKMQEKAKTDYEAALARYSGYADTHLDIFLQSANTKKEALNNDVQMKLNVYNTASAQYQSALCKLQERMPSFTVIQPAVVAQKPTGPKRMIFVAGMMILAMIGTSLWVLRRDVAPFYDAEQK